MLVPTNMTLEALPLISVGNRLGSAIFLRQFANVPSKDN